MRKGGIVIIYEIALRQHVGAPCAPVVKKGDKVKRGTLIATPTGLGANIFASVSGKISNITDSAIFIELAMQQSADFVPLPKAKDRLAAIQAAGVVGAGGAGFPTHIKLKADLNGGCVIANAAECEPVLLHNVAFMEMQPKVVVRGLLYAMEITGANKGIIAIKPKHQKALIALANAAKEHKNIDIKLLPNIYPVGDERVIVREITGIELVPGQLPIEAKCVIMNVETIKRCVEAIELNKPFIDKDITVCGKVKNCAERGEVFLDVPIGTKVSELIDKAGGIVEPYGEIQLGGPFTGKHGEPDSPVTKTLGGVIVTECFPNTKLDFGIISCECGAQEERLREIVAKMGGTVVAEQKCKRMTDDGRGRFRCDLPGICPGQAETVLKLRSGGAKALLIGNCED